MDMKTKQSIFTGNELDKLLNFCKECAEEDKKIHEERKNNPSYKESPNPSKHKHEHNSLFSANNSNNYNESNNYKKSNNQKPKAYRKDEPNAHNSRMKADTFNQRLQLFGGNK